MIIWILFIAAIVCFLALDLGVFHRDSHIISSKEAGKWTIAWVSIAFLFAIVISWLYRNALIENPSGLSSNAAALKYITGYLIELSLSVDNIFVIAVIFSSFQIPHKYQHRVLFWGILGAVIFRGLLIYLGITLINAFTWTAYVFGLFLVFTAVKMLFGSNETFEPKQSWLYKMIGKIIPMTHHLKSDHFFVIKNSRKVATPLFIALIVIEVMDVVFALDSVPAILAITSDPFLVFSSNIFAILGLRSMYFLLAGMLRKFEYLEYSLIAILMFVGIKMLVHKYYTVAEWMSLAFIILSLASGILISICKRKETSSQGET